jgi:hypothetical protein
VIWDEKWEFELNQKNKIWNAQKMNKWKVGIPNATRHSDDFTK